MTLIEKLVVSSIALFLAAVVFSIVDQATSDKVIVGTGEVVSKSYVPSQASTGVGYSHGKNGGPVVINTTSQEAFVLLVTMQGELVSASTTANVWASVSEGDKVKVHRYEGVMFNGKLEVGP